jgi:hypothetical protein
VLVVALAVIAALALVVSLLFVRDTGAHGAHEQRGSAAIDNERPPRLREALALASWREPSLRACSQAGLSATSPAASSRAGSRTRSASTARLRSSRA